MRRDKVPDSKPEKSDRNAVVVYCIPRTDGTPSYAVTIECADEALRDVLTEKAKTMIRSGLV